MHVVIVRRKINARARAQNIFFDFAVKKMDERERFENIFFLKKDIFGGDFLHLFKKEIQNLRKDSFKLEDLKSFGTIVDPHICLVGSILTPILFGYSNVRLIPEKNREKTVMCFDNNANQNPFHARYAYDDEDDSSSFFEPTDTFQLKTACLYVGDIVLFLVRSDHLLTALSVKKESEGYGHGDFYLCYKSQNGQDVKVLDTFSSDMTHFDFDVYSKNIILWWFLKNFGQLIYRIMSFESASFQNGSITGVGSVDNIEKKNQNELNIQFLRLESSYEIKYDAAFGSSKDYYDQVIERAVSHDRNANRMFRIER